MQGGYKGVVFGDERGSILTRKFLSCTCSFTKFGVFFFYCFYGLVRVSSLFWRQASYRSERGILRVGGAGGPPSTVGPERGLSCSGNL